MATVLLSTRSGMHKSGWALVVGAENPNDVAEFIDSELETIRREAPAKMHRAVNHMVIAIKKTLARQYPLVSGFIRRTSWGTTKSGRERRQPSPPGSPPGRITGDLMRSWTKGRLSWSMGRMVLTGRYESKHPAAGRLERGDLGRDAWLEPGQKGGIRPRPYVRPTLLREAERLSQLLDGAE